MKKSEIAEATRETIEKLGWVRKSYNTETGNCLLGAACLATTGSTVFNFSFTQDGPKVSSHMVGLGEILAPGLSDAENTIIAIYSSYPTEDRYKIVFYNDEIASGIDDALEVCDRAAKYWRDQGE